MTIFEALKSDHDQLRPLLSRLVEATEADGAEEMKEVVEQVETLLIPHSRAEEAVFYNLLRDTDTARELVRESYTEHAKAETILRTLKALSTVKIEWTRAAKKLQNELEHHITEEEGPVFDAARLLLSEEDAEQLGRAFEAMKFELTGHGTLKNMVQLVVNLLPERFRNKFKETAA